MAELFDVTPEERGAVVAMIDRIGVGAAADALFVGTKTCRRVAEGQRVSRAVVYLVRHRLIELANQEGV